jgi:hypothetical protein
MVLGASFPRYQLENINNEVDDAISHLRQELQWP